VSLRFTNRILVALVALAACVAVARADVPPLPPEKASPVAIPLVEAAPVIDGRLDDAAWKSAAVLKDFVQIQPGDNTSPLKPTEVMLAYDAKTLYIAFHCVEDPDKVRATLSRREAYFASDDYVVFYLDTFNDKRRAFVFVLNPLGIQGDGIFTEGRGEDYSIELVWESKGQLTDDGYTIEIAIPFKSLRYEAGEGKVWNAHFFRRVQHANRALDSWMPNDRENSSSLRQAGQLTGLVGIDTEHNLEINPSLTISETGQRVRAAYFGEIFSTPGLVDNGRFINRPVVADPGINVKYGITPTVTLDFAANPDFAQVEADSPVITANLRFPIFFAERRPFFLEGLDYFQSFLTPVHTRTIIDPDVAVKLTGKRGPYTFGIMGASDNAPGSFSKEELADPFVRERNERFIEKNSTIGVIRVKRDVGVDNSLGFTATSYDFVDRHNKVGGFDGRFRIDAKTLAEFQLLGTHTRGFVYDPYRDDVSYRTLNGFGYFGRVERASRNTYFELYGEGRSTNYATDVGFVSRPNTNFNSFYAQYNTDPQQGKKLVNWQISNFVHIDYDFQGRMQIWEDEINVRWQFAKNTSFGVAYEKAYERVFEYEFGPTRTATRPGAFTGPDDERSTSKHHYFVFGNVAPTRAFALDYRIVMRDGHFDYDFGAGPEYPRVSPAALLDPGAPYDPGPGRLWEFSGGLTLVPTTPLRTTLTYNKQRLTRYDTNRVAFDDNLFSWRTVYQFSPSTSVRARIDYSTLSSRARAQFLYAWQPSPGTSFFVGYNDDASFDHFNPFSRALEPGFRRNGRQFFVKMSYLLRWSL
jgi:hypothetical protein